jgi:hypothetical protein
VKDSEEIGFAEFVRQRDALDAELRLARRYSDVAFIRKLE